MGSVSEIESLRSQVAELARELAERDQVLSEQHRRRDAELQDLREQSQRLRAIVTGTAEETGDDFFPALVTQLTSVLGVQYAVIGEVRQDSGTKKIRTVAVAAGGTLVDNFEYDLSGTPCQTALVSSFACFAQGVQASFPSFTRLRQLNVEGYCGVSIRAKSGAVIGLLVVMDVKPIDDPDWLRSLLTIFASRAAAELERARAEHERNQALGDLHNVMETIPDILFTLDLQGHLVRWNQTLERVTGYSAMELLNKHALEFVPPAEYEPTTSAIQRAFQDGYAELEGHLLTKDGRTIPYYWTGATLHNSHGQVVGLTGVGRDITDRKREEEKRLLLYKAIFTHSIDGIAIVDPEGRYLTQNLAHEQMLGYSQDQLTGKTPAMHLGEEAFSHIVGELVSTGQFRGEVASCTASGESLPLDLAAFAMYDETGSTTCYVGIKRDIKRRKQAEEALAHLNATLEQQVEERTKELRTSEARLRLAMDIADLATWDWDISTNKIVWSENCEQVKRLQPGTFDGTFEAYQRLVHPDDLPTLFADINRALAGPSPYHTEHRIVPPGDETQWVEGNGIVYRNENGQPIRMVGTVHNITARKLAEEALRTSEARFRELAEGTTDWMWEIDAQGRYTYCSPKIYDILGYEPGEVLGKTPFDFMTEDEARRVAALFGPIAAAKQPFSGMENVNRHKDGPLVVLERRGEPILDADGMLKGYRGFDQDITRRKWSELRNRERLDNMIRFQEIQLQLQRQPRQDLTEGLRMTLRMAANALSIERVGLWLFNEDRSSLICRELYQLSLDTYESGAVLDASHYPHYFDALNETLPLVANDALADPRTSEFVEEYLIPHGIRSLMDVAVRRDGIIIGVIWFEHIGLKTEWSEEEQVFATSIGDHVALCLLDAQRQQTEIALRASEELFAKAFRFSPDPMVLVELDTGRWIEANEACLAGLGRRREEVIGRTGDEIGHWVKPEDRRHFVEALKRNGTIHNVEGSFRPAHGEVRECLVSAERIEYHGKPCMIVLAKDITERKQAEELIREMNLALAQAMPGISRITPDGLYLDVNNSYADLLGYEPTELIGHSWEPTVHPQDLPLAYAAYQEMLREGKGEFECRAVRKDGSLFFKHVLMVKGDETSVLGFSHHCFMRDITDRKQAEQALRSSEEKLRESLLASNTGLWDWNTETNEVWFSREWKKQLGYEEAELPDTFETWESRLHPDDHDRAVAYAVQYRDNSVGAFRQDFRLRHKDGTYRWIDSHASFVAEPDGRRVRLLGSHTDITARKQAEEDLKLFRTLLDQVTDSIEVIEPTSGQFLDGNRQSYESIGYTRSELSALTVPDIDPLVTKPVFQEYMQRLREAPAPLRIESLHLRKDGSTFPVEVVAQIIRHDREYLVAVVRDITDRKKMEAALVQQQEYLQLFIEHSPVALAMFDQEMRYIAVSRRWQLDYHDEPLIGRSHYEVCPDIPERWKALHQRCLAGAVERCEEDAFVRADGHIDWTRWEIRPWLTANGSVGGIVIFAEDISERKRAEEALRTSEERYARATAIGKVGVWQLDIASGQYHGDDNLKALFGYGPDELSTDPYAWLELVHPDDQSIALQAWEQILSRATDEYYYAIRMIRKDGTIIWTDVRGHAEREERGGLLRLIGATVDITERKQAQEALAERERELRTMLNALPIGVWFTNQQGQVLYGNPVGQRIWSDAVKVGLPDHTLGIGHWENIQATNLPHRWAIGSVLTGDQPVLNEMLEIETANGSRKTIRNWAVEVRTDAGAIQGAIVLNEDITERKRAEEVLRLTQFSIDRAVDGVFWVAPNARILSVNEAACQMLEYSREELTSMTVHDIDPNFPPEAWPAHWEELQQKRSITFESKHWTKTGRVLETEVTVNYLQYEGREYNCAIMRDIGERKRAEAELRRSHAFIRQVIDTDPNFIFAKDREGRFTLVNSAVAECYGTTVDELIGKSDADFNSNPQEVAFFRQLDLDVMDSMQERFIPEEQITDSTGRIRWLQTVKRPIIDDQGRATMILGAATDITERKQAEEALAQSEQAIRALHEATAAAGLSFEERIQQVLEVGCRRFNLPIGMLTQVVGTRLELAHVWAPGTAFTAGVTVPLEQTYCNTTLQKPDPVCFAHAGASDWQYHPGYKALGLESYIGTKLIGRDQIHGTICFAGENPLPTSFSQADTDFVQLMARWISGEMDRRLAEQALKHSEERYRALYDDTPTMYFTLAIDGTVRSVNRYGAEQLGYAVEELVGHSVLGVFHDEDKETVATSLSECLATPETTKHWEFRKVRKDGTVIWVRETARVGQSSTGETVVLVTCEDITERKRAEAALKEAERRYRTIFEQAPVGIATTDSLTGRFLSVNASYGTITGYTREEMLDRTFLDITHPDDLQADLDQMKRLLDGDIAMFERDKRYVRKNGDTTWVHLICVPLWQQPSDPRIHLAIVQDITERKRAEERTRHFQNELEQLVEARTTDLQKTHRLLQSVIDSSPDWIFVKDREYRFVLVNKAFAASQNLTPADITGRLDTDFWPHELCEGNAEKGIRGFHTDDRCAFAGEMIHNPYDPASLHDGSLRVFDTYKGPWYDPNGQVGGVLCYARDVTEQRHAEEIVRQLNSELAIRVDERTAELAQVNRLLEADIAERKRVEEALRQRERDLRAAVEERERISEDLHDGILQSIYAIGLGLEACTPLLSELPNKSATKLNVVLRRTIGQLNSVLEEVRNFIAGLESQILAGQEFDLVLRTMVHTLAAPYSIPCRVTIDQAAAQALSTEQAYHVMNIVREAMSNSLRHSEATRITVSLTQLSRSVRLSIIDSGVGFNPDAKRDRGHGLANMAARAQKLGGKFALQSKPDQGTKVLVDIPRRLTDADI